MGPEVERRKALEHTVGCYQTLSLEDDIFMTFGATSKRRDWTRACPVGRHGRLRWRDWQSAAPGW